MGRQHLCFICLVLATGSCPFVQALVSDLLFHGVNSDVYANPGDVNIGVIMTLTRGVTNMSCTKVQISGSWGMEYPEAVAFAVDAVNQDPDLLQNITLGFYILDDCSARQMALAQALKFLPRSSQTCEAMSRDRLVNISKGRLSTRYNPEELLPSYDVTAVLAPMFSITAVPVSYLCTAAKMPIIGYLTTSDELSDKTLHPYFLRVISPDKYQTRAITRFIADRGWTYVSVLYTEGPYGERAFDNFKMSAALYNICIATANLIRELDESEIFVDEMLRHEARVVVFFADSKPFRHIVDSVKKFNASGHFIWIGSDALTSVSKITLNRMADSINGAFLFLFYTPVVPEFRKYLGEIDIFSTRNPWLKTAWEYLMSCSFTQGTCLAGSGGFKSDQFMLPPIMVMDAVLAIAHAIEKLISDFCPGVSGAQAVNCIKRDVLLEYISKVEFRGYTGDIKFDYNGDVNGKYVIYQVKYDSGSISLDRKESNNSSEKFLEYKEVAFYEIQTDSVLYTNATITWDHLTKKERVVPLRHGEVDNGQPESLCSRPCIVGEYKIQKQLKCCWECRKCRDNERIINQNTSCEECEIFTWPEPETGFTTCSPIPLAHPTFSDSVAILQTTISGIALILTCLVCSTYTYYRESRVIKAASRELSVLQLLAISAGYLTVVCFQTHPTPAMCGVLYFLFCLSFAGLYSPLFVKAVRIYRIFQSSSQNNKRLRFVSPQSQIVLSIILIFVQVALCIAMYILYQPTARKTQPVTTKKFVELNCDLTLPGLASFLAYNLVLVLLCSVFAFKTRKLPENFNESQFISMCVSTTLVIWLAFIPTYYTAGRQFVRNLLLSASLLLNHTVALVFLFLPKVYAVLYLPSRGTSMTSINKGFSLQNSSAQ